MKHEEYKSVCNSCGMKTWYETEQPCKRTEVPIYCKCCNEVTGYGKCHGTLKLIDTSALNPQLHTFYKSGERVEVIYSDGNKNRFYVGKSTGWKPCYLEIKKSNSTGGGEVYLPQDAQVRGLGIYK